MSKINGNTLGHAICEAIGNHDYDPFNDVQDPESIEMGDSDYEVKEEALERERKARNKQEFDCLEDQLCMNIVQDAIGYLASYEGAFRALEKFTGGEAIKAVVTLTTHRKMRPFDAIRFISRLMSQCTRNVFFELSRREWRMEQKINNNIADTSDGDESEAMQALLNAIEQQYEDTSDPNDVEDEATTVESASDHALRVAIEDLNVFFNSIYGVFYQGAFRRHPEEPLGYTQVQTRPGKWREVRSFDEAFELFKMEQEDKRKRRDAGFNQDAMRMLNNMLKK